VHQVGPMHTAVHRSSLRAGSARRPPRIVGRNVVAQLLLVQEAERRRVSREMHNDLAQRVALLEFEIESMKRRLSERPGVSRQQDLRELVLPELETLRGAVGLLADDVHRICEQLHPAVLENLGLARGIASLCEDHARTISVKPVFVHGIIPVTLPASVSLCLYRVVQEALRNAAKYAGASEVTVTLRREGRGIRAMVTDNGCGFDRKTLQRPGLGLMFVAERVKLLGGRSNVRSAPGKGARISVWVPCRPAGDVMTLRKECNKVQLVPETCSRLPRDRASIMFS
jgi:signal transduction histidine kinase